MNKEQCQIIRDGCRNYLMIEITEPYRMDQEEWEQFQALPVKGLLSCTKRYRDGMEYFCYDVTGKQSLAESYEEAEIPFQELRNLLLSLDRNLKNVHEYLLSEDFLRLSPEMIYADAGKKEVFMVYSDDGNRKFSEKIRELAEFILNRVDHKDDNSVILAYQFYKYASMNSFNMEEFLKENRSALYPEEADETREDQEEMHVEDGERKKTEPAGQNAERTGKESGKEAEGSYYELLVSKLQEKKGKKKYQKALLFLPLPLLGAAFRIFIYDRIIVLALSCAYLAAVILYFRNKRKLEQYEEKEQQLYTENMRQSGE